MSDVILKIQEPFNEQYTLIIQTDMLAVDAKMASKTQIRWDFTILEVKDDTIECRLILLENNLIESNNALIKEIALLNQGFSRMFSELHLKISQEGIVKDVLNMDIILSKWKNTKIEMEKIANNTPEIKNSMLLYDNIFQDKKKITQGIQASEFFMMYFGYIMNKVIPYSNQSITKPNIFNTINVQWQMNISKANEIAANEVIYNVETKPFLPLTSGFYNKAYGQFADKIDVSKLNTTLQESAVYKIDSKTNKIISAVLHKIEIADDKQLYSKLKYTFMSENAFLSSLKNKEIQNKQQLQNNSEQKQQESQKQQKPYMMYEGKSFSTKEEWDDFEKKKYEEFVKERDRKKNNFF
jgi:hypothetical protein